MRRGHSQESELSHVKSPSSNTLCRMRNEFECSNNARRPIQMDSIERRGHPVAYFRSMYFGQLKFGTAGHIRRGTLGANNSISNNYNNSHESVIYNKLYVSALYSLPFICQSPSSTFVTHIFFVRVWSIGQGAMTCWRQILESISEEGRGQLTVVTMAATTIHAMDYQSHESSDDSSCAMDKFRNMQVAATATAATVVERKSASHSHTDRHPVTQYQSIFMWWPWEIDINKHTEQRLIQFALVTFLDS